MKKILVFLVFLAVAAILYSVFSDPEKREQLLSTIEGSTGVDLEASPDQMLERAGEAVGSAADKLLKDLGNTLTDPKFHQSLEKWGRDALESLDEADLRRLKRDLEKESDRMDSNYDEVLERYLGSLDNS
ncbi:MAG: hypothetical protein RQ801_15270 [Spirochaetaceae bacterium]|nr:hypothetical protein [Spirochaetaceae bacterium]MDT8299667.1 hypothetical protein [Spirochaetaceae bacterium]